jgi:hypothetical protein
MILLLTILRWVSLLIWLVLIARLAPSAYRAMGKRRRNLDPLWAIICGLAINRAWFVIRAIHYEEAPLDIVEAGTLVIGYMMAGALAFGLLKLRTWYGD